MTYAECVSFREKKAFRFYGSANELFPQPPLQLASYHKSRRSCFLVASSLRPRHSILRQNKKNRLFFSLPLPPGSLTKFPSHGAAHSGRPPCLRIIYARRAARGRSDSALELIEFQ